MKNIKIKIITLISIFAIMLSSISVYASMFNDINNEDEMYKSIQNIVEKGLMVGNLQGNFNPNSYVDKFSMIKIASKIMGYEKDDDKSAKYKDKIMQYSKKYSIWDNNANDKISFLIKNNILLENELDEFIIIDKNKKEQLRALSREELASFLSKIIFEKIDINAKEKAKNIQYKLFYDTDSINKEKAIYCYYIDMIGIMPRDEKAMFYPKSAVTRYELAKILDKFLNYTGIDINKEKNTKKDCNTENIYTRMVSIEGIYPEKRKMQIRDEKESKVYNISDDVQVMIDKNISNIYSIKEGSGAKIFIRNSKIYKINVDTKMETKFIKKTFPTNIYGIIKNVSKDSLGIYYKDIISNTNIKDRIEIIPLAKDYTVIKNGMHTKDMLTGNLGTITIKDGFIKEIVLEDENAIFLGNIINIDKKYITIKTNDNKIFELQALDDSIIIKNKKNISLDKLKIGDSVVINTKKDKIKKIEAEGNTSKLSGTISGINIGERNYITIKDDKLRENTYVLDKIYLDIYSLRLLDKVEITLGSKEIIDIKIINRENYDGLDIEVIQKYDDKITAYIKNNTNKIKIDIYIDENTKIFIDNKEKWLKDIKKGDMAYISFKDKKNKYASSINIIS